MLLDPLAVILRHAVRATEAELIEFPPTRVRYLTLACMAFALFGAALVLCGVLLPGISRGQIPEQASVPPVSGMLLLKASLVLDGLVFMWFARRWLRACRVPVTPAMPGDGAWEERGAWDISRRAATVGLLLITLLALVLRVLGVNSDLWLDEIASLVDYRDVSPLGVLLSYAKPNNHLLNTELVKLATSVAGEGAWVVRLPAVLFGIAAIPAMYWVARPVAGRLPSLCAALLLAVSYHHIFFSQNARGYSGYLLFSLLATGCLVRGLDRDRPRYWLGYVVSMAFNFASLLHAGFILAGHIVIGAAALVQRQRRGDSAGALARRMALVFGATAVFALQLYLPVILQAWSVLGQVYSKPSAGMPITSHAFIADLAKGLTEGVGGGLLALAIPAAAVAAVGTAVLLRRSWILAASFMLPLGLLALLVAFWHLAASPRFFLLGLPLAILAAVLGVFTLAARAAKRAHVARHPVIAAGLAAGTVGLMAIASAASLPAYYRVPKQSYQAALASMRTDNRPGELIVLVQNAELGFRFYGEKSNLQEDRDFVAVRTLDEFHKVRAGGRNLVVVTTLERGLRLEAPNLLAAIEGGWSPAKILPATIHEGEIRIWRARE